MRRGYRVIASDLDRAIPVLLKGDEILVAMLVREQSYKTYLHRDTEAGRRPVPVELNLARIARDLGKSRPTLSRLVHAMVRQGILRESGVRGVYLVKDYREWLDAGGRPRIDALPEAGLRFLAEAAADDRERPPDWAVLAALEDERGGAANSETEEDGTHRGVARRQQVQAGTVADAQQVRMDTVARAQHPQSLARGENAPSELLETRTQVVDPQDVRSSEQGQASSVRFIEQGQVSSVRFIEHPPYPGGYDGRISADTGGVAARIHSPAPPLKEGGIREIREGREGAARAHPRGETVIGSGRGAGDQDGAAGEYKGCPLSPGEERDLLDWFGRVYSDPGEIAGLFARRKHRYPPAWWRKVVKRLRLRASSVRPPSAAVVAKVLDDWLAHGVETGHEDDFDDEFRPIVLPLGPPMPVVPVVALAARPTPPVDARADQADGPSRDEIPHRPQECRRRAAQGGQDRGVRALDLSRALPALWAAP